MKQNLEILKINLEENQSLLKSKELVKPLIRNEIKNLEKELKERKRILNRVIKEINWHKKRNKTLRNAISSYPRRLRLWTENHIGELISKVEEVKEYE